jgi:hypothetical protein
MQPFIINEFQLVTIMTAEEPTLRGSSLKERALSHGCLMGDRAVAVEVAQQLNVAKNSGLSLQLRNTDAALCIPDENDTQYIRCLCWDWNDGLWVIREVSTWATIGEAVCVLAR